MMDRRKFTKNCRALGLKVSRLGDVYDSAGVLAQIDDDSIAGGDNPNIQFADILEISYIEINHLLTLKLMDDTAYAYHSVPAIAGPGSSPIAMPTSICELDDMFDLIFPGADTGMYYDVMMEQGMVDPALFDMPSEIEGFVPLSDDVYPFYYSKMERRLREIGCTGRFPGIQTRNMVLKMRITSNQRNLFREWVESHKWDGVSRMGRWFIDGLGATAPPLEAINRDVDYLEGVTTAWFMGGIQRMFQEAKTEVVPVLIGGEGIGKGNFLRYTAGFNDDWFIDTSASLEGPGAEEKFLEGIRGCVIVELSESTQFSTVKGTELLKTFVSKSRDRHRKAYATEPVSSIRRFMLIATSNKNNIFIDVGGGNRRYFPMYCDPNKAIRPYDPQFKVIGRYEVEQVWAEALAKYKANDKAESYITPELAALAKEMQEYGTIEDTNVTQIDEWLNDPENGYDEVGAMISKDEIFFKILGVPVGNGCIVPTSADLAFRNWSAIQKCWQKLKHPLNKNGHQIRNVYRRMYTEAEASIKRRSNMVHVEPGTESRFIDVVGIIRSRAEKFHYKDMGDPFPVAGLSGEELRAILDSGYVECDGDGSYSLVCMP